MEDQQKQWATDLQKAINKTKKDSGDTEGNTRVINKKIAEKKEEIIKVAEKKDIDGAKKLFFELIQLRATHTALGIKKMKENGKLTKDLAEKVAEYFITDCINLAIAVDSILGINYGTDS